MKFKFQILFHHFIFIIIELILIELAIFLLLDIHYNYKPDIIIIQK